MKTTDSDTPSAPPQNSPTLRRDASGRLTALVEGRWVGVSLRPCFPWTSPERFLSLRDSDHGEVALIEALEALDTESKAAAEAALAEARFAFDVVRLISVEEAYELRLWRMVTRQGERRFVTQLEDWPERRDDGQVLIRDVSGDLYRVAGLEQLDKASRQLLWNYLP